MDTPLTYPAISELSAHPELRDRFWRGVDDDMQRLWPKIGLGIAAAALLWWPLDPWVFYGLDEAQAAMAQLRVGAATVLLVCGLVGPHFSLYRDRPIPLSAATAALLLGYCGWCLADAGQGSAFWLSFSYVSPLFAVGMVQPLLGRWLSTCALSAGFVSGFLAHPSDTLGQPGAWACLSALAFMTALSVVLGHLYTRQLERSFLLQVQAEGQQRQLARLAARLEERVSEQTQQLRGLHLRFQEAGAEERRVLARELHDGLGQELSSLRLLSGLGKSLATDPPTRAVLSELEELVGRVQLTLRHVLTSLRPHLVEEQGLVEALRTLLADVERRWGLGGTLSLEDVPDPLEPDHSTAVFRIVQEALHNVIQHAGASEARVRLAGTPGGGLALEVQDNGRGLPPGARGRGLTHIAERAAALGGRAEWQVEAGTRLAVHLPPRSRT